MLGRIVAAITMIALAIAIFPIINTTLKDSQMNISSTPSSISGDLNTMLGIVPYVFMALVALIVIMFIMQAFRSSGDSDSDDEDEDEEDDEEDEEDDDESSAAKSDSVDDEEEEPDDESEQLQKPKKHTTIVTTRKREVTPKGAKTSRVVRTNVKVGPGYNVDKYELEKPADTKLSYKEENFKKTKYD